MKNNGFTIIETLIAMTIGTTITAGAVSYQYDRNQGLLAEKTIEDINLILKTVDEKIKEEGLQKSKWNKSVWNNESEIVSGLFENDLGLNIWSEGLNQDILINAEIKYDSLDHFQNFNFYISFDSEEIFNDNFKHFNKASRVK